MTWLGAATKARWVWENNLTQARVVPQNNAHTRRKRISRSL